MTDFVKTYLTVANTQDALKCTPEFVAELRQRLLTDAPELENIAFPLLASISVGARRPDIVYHLFSAAIDDVKDDDDLLKIYHQFSSMIITVWPYVGGPWCNPAMMSIATILKSRDFTAVDRLSIRPGIRPTDLEAGNDLLNNRYNATKDPNVQSLLSTYCRDFGQLTRTVALGYCHVGTTMTGIYSEHETELILAAALAGSGATRSATVHGKTALALGNSPQALRATYETAEYVNRWNGVRYNPANVDQIIADVEAL